MVMVIDDHSDVCNALVRLVQMQGCEAEGITNPLLAMTRIRTKMPCLIILDDMMPGMSGLDLLRELHDTEDLKNIPVAMHSAAYNDKRAADAKKLGAVAWVRKGELDSIIDLVAQYDTEVA